MNLCRVGLLNQIGWREWLTNRSSRLGALTMIQIESCELFFLRLLNLTRRGFYHRNSYLSRSLLFSLKGKWMSEGIKESRFPWWKKNYFHTFQLSTLACRPRSSDKPKMDDHDPDLSSTKGVLINEPLKLSFLTKPTKRHDMLILIDYQTSIWVTSSDHWIFQD